MESRLRLPEADVIVTDAGDGRRKIEVKLKKHNAFMPLGDCETSYPMDLIKAILDVKGPAFLCDEIARDESPEYLQKVIHFDVFGYIDRERFKQGKVLDFGCGCGASTMVLSRLLPETSLTGVELEASLLRIAELRAAHYKTGARVRFLRSPNGNSLPPDVGDFDFILLSGVYEHLLPEERQVVLPLLWSHLKPGGVLFLFQTPYRWFPVEFHTTHGLAFINYMPAAVAAPYARRFSKAGLGQDSWSTLLRRGIRGGSAAEVIGILNRHSPRPVLLTPGQLGLKDRIDMMYAVLGKSRYPVARDLLFYASKLWKAATGQIFLPQLSLAIEKPKGV